MKTFNSGKIKLGDRIKITNGTCPAISRGWIGKVGTVVRIDDVDETTLPFRAKIGDNTFWVNGVKVEEEPEAKVEKPEEKRMKKSNLIEIDFQDLGDGNTTILEIRNLLNKDQITEKYGRTVRAKYMHWKGETASICAPNFQSTVTMFARHKQFMLRKLPVTLSNRSFSALVKYMKAAGENLLRLSKEEKAKKSEKAKTQTITI